MRTLTLPVAGLILLATFFQCCPSATPEETPVPSPPTATQEAVEAEPTATHTPFATPMPAYTTYVVQSGDTLSGIAGQFGTTAEAIMELNGLTSTIIYSGTQLLIPSTDVPVSPPTAIATSSDTPTPRPPTPTRQPTPTPLQEWRGVYIGMPADDVLKVWGQGLRTNVLGQDTQGLVVEWVYQDATLTMKRWQEGRITCYRVAKIRLH